MNKLEYIALRKERNEKRDSTKGMGYLDSSRVFKEIKAIDKKLSKYESARRLIEKKSKR